jgi:hypothetical protein
MRKPTENPIVRETIQRVNREIAKEVLIKLAELPPKKKGLSIYKRIGKRFLAVIDSIRAKIKSSIEEGESLAGQSLLPDPEFIILQVKETGPIPRGCSIWEYDVTNLTVVKAPVEEVDNNSKKCKAIIEKPGCQYFYALNEKTAKEKVGLT